MDPELTQDEEDDRYLGGRLLIATPAIGDPRFDRSVILVCDHSPEHAMGIILNKPVKGLRMPALLEQLGVENSDAAPDLTVLQGGPVDRDRGFVLHTGDFDSLGATLPVAPDLGLTATKDVLTAIASDHPPRRVAMALGYAGWGAGQLDSELQDNAWLVVDPDEAMIFGEETEGKWEAALARLGVTPEKLSGLTGTA